MVVPAARVPGTDGRKMSKSYGNAVDLVDDPRTVYDKLSKMVTDVRRKRRSDPGDPKDCPAFRLHEIYCTPEEREELTVGCRTASIGCLDCKKVMIHRVVAGARSDSHAPPPPRGETRRGRRGARGRREPCS